MKFTENIKSAISDLNTTLKPESEIILRSNKWAEEIANEKLDDQYIILKNVKEKLKIINQVKVDKL